MVMLWIMLRRHRIKLLVFAALMGVTAYFAIASWGPSPITLCIAKVEDTSNTKRVTIRCERHDATTRFKEDQQFQVRIAGQWQPPQAMPSSQRNWLWPGNTHPKVELDLPLQAESCRLLLNYRTGARPYCVAYGYLMRHKLMDTFPALSKTVLKLVPSDTKLQHRVYEFELPAASAIAGL